MAADMAQVYAFFDTINYNEKELEIIYGNAPQIKDMKVFDKLLTKCLDKYDDWKLFFYLINKYDVETGEIRKAAQ